MSALLAELAVHHLDMIIADRPMPASLNVRGYSHLLGEWHHVLWNAKPRQTIKRQVPHLPERCPLLLPGEDAAIRTQIIQWFEANNLRPEILGEFDDSALMKAFGQAGAGLFVAPTTLASHVCKTVQDGSHRPHRLCHRTAVCHHDGASPDAPGHRRDQQSRPRRHLQLSHKHINKRPTRILKVA